MKTLRISTAVAVLAVSIASGAFAQGGAYPAKPVRIILPFGAGGPADIYTRAVAQRLGEPLGQQVIVEDRPGAGSRVGTEAAVKSAPDGYTLLMIKNEVEKWGKVVKLSGAKVE